MDHPTNSALPPPLLRPHATGPETSWLLCFALLPLALAGCMHEGLGKPRIWPLALAGPPKLESLTDDPPPELPPIRQAGFVESLSDQPAGAADLANAAPEIPAPIDDVRRQGSELQDATSAREPSQLQLASTELPQDQESLPAQSSVADTDPSAADPERIPLPDALQPDQLAIPLQGAPRAPNRIESEGSLVTISVREAPLHSVLSLIAQQQGLSIVAPSGPDIPITVTLQPTTLENALDAIMAISGCTWTQVNDVIYVTPVQKDTPESFLIQGREVHVFDLNYLSATDAEEVVTGLLSPVGKVFTRQVDAKEKLKTHEQLVIEDLPTYADRVANYIARADQPPRQVMVEARLLQVKLQQENRHGVDFDVLARLAGADVTIGTTGFNSDTPPAAIVSVEGTDFDSLIDCLTATTDAKTLAAPKLLMINGQESKIQIGRRLGYFVTTTTQTSTLQDVQFLEVGVVLNVTPQITADGQILMKVHPKVSSGDINPTTTLPEEETTEVETSVMVPDGEGVIIGGLIQEVDNERQAKVPFLGDVWGLGWLFQRRTIDRDRVELVVALRPRIVSDASCPTPAEAYDLDRTYSPLLTPTLNSAPRPEPILSDALTNPSWPPNRRISRR